LDRAPSAGRKTSGERPMGPSRDFDMMPTLKKKNAMTLIETLIVVSLVGLLGLAIYQSLANGIRIWDRSREIVTEEDVIVFFDKINTDLRNAFFYSKIRFEGGEYRFTFPTLVYTPQDTRISDRSEDEYVDQIGKVEYYYDFNEDAVFRRQANYSQALNEQFGEPRKMVGSIGRIKFNYYYLTGDGEIYSTEVYDTIPEGIEIEIEFEDNSGKRIMRKFLDIPVGS
jgi:prepilin-type N-terminal cleavage/methylation domain-containing protein